MNINDSGRCLLCKNARCASACPINTNIPEAMRLYREGKLDKAGELLFANNPMAAITSLVCDWENNCYGHCVLNVKKNPIDWHSIEAEISWEHLSKVKINPGAYNGKKIAIVGGGPAGIAAAIWLCQEGCHVEIFDENPRLGGVLRYGIPSFRLDRKYIDIYESILNEAGVVFNGGKKIGKDININHLRENFDAVMLSTGASVPRTLDIPGEENGRIIYALDYLKDPDSYGLSGKVLVIGGGNVTMDASRTALRQGCDTWVYYRKSFENMPANAREIEEAKEEGVRFCLFEVPVAINGDVAIMRKCENITREDGRIATRMIEGSDHEVRFDHMLVAISANIDLGVFYNSDSAASEKGWLKLSEEQETSLKGVFAAGDLVLGPSSVVESVASARKAVDSILKHIHSPLNH